MNRDLKNIDQLFHQNIAGAGEQPPAGLWDRIETSLDKAEGVTTLRKKDRLKRIAYFFFFVIAATGAALLWTYNNTEEGIIENTALAASQAKPAASMPAVSNGKAQRPVSTITPKEPLVVAGKGLVKVDEPWKAEVSLSNQLQNETHHAGKTVPGDKPAEQEQAARNEIVSWAKNASGQTVKETGANTNRYAVLAETVPSIAPPRLLNDAPQTLPAQHNNIFAGAKAPPLVRVKKANRFAVTLFFAPDITTRNLEQNSFGAIPFMDERKEELLRTEKNGALDFTVGARMEYKLNKRWSILSGLSFSTNNIDIAPKMVFARFDKDGALKFRFNLSSGYTFFKSKTAMLQPRFLGDTAQALSSNSILHYVNIPLAIKLNFPSGRFNFSVQAGMAARFITSQSIDAVYAFNGGNEKGRSESIQGLKTMYFNGVVGAGVDYALSNKMALSFFPSFNFATTSINRDAPVKAYPNTLSIATGVKFTL